jgi:hypothetical protein
MKNAGAVPAAGAASEFLAMLARKMRQVRIPKEIKALVSVKWRP